MSSRLTPPPAACDGATGRRGDGETCSPSPLVAPSPRPETAGRLLGTGPVSNATRLMSIRGHGEMLSEGTLPPQEPPPKGIEGGSAVEDPAAPRVGGGLATTPRAGPPAPQT